jgi:hypothetical protein
MSASFPNSVKTFTPKENGPSKIIQAEHINEITDEITAIETLLLTPEPVATKSISFYVDGVLVAETNALSIISPQALNIIAVVVKVDAAPTDADVIVDINKNGTSVYTTQANRPTIAAGTTSVTAALPDVVSIAQYDKVTLDIDQVGSTIAGENLSMIVVCEVV